MMRKVLGFLLLGGGIAAGWQFMHPGVELPKLGSLKMPSLDAAVQTHARTPAAAGASAPSLAQQPAPVAGSATVATVAADSGSRTFSPSSPLFAQVGQEPQAGNLPTVVVGGNGSKSAATGMAAPKADGQQAVVVTAITPAVTSSTPALPPAARKPVPGEEAQRALVRDIQKELKRVGCYAGDATGQWSPATTRAMATYVGSSNASLPVDKPDVAFLAMLKAEKAETGCSPACGKGQVSAGSGICVPRPILASRGKPAGDAAGAPAPARLATAQPQAVVQPLPGAMAIGGPKVEAGQEQDDTGISPSITNTQPAQQPQAVQAPAPIARKLPPPAAAAQAPKKEQRPTRSASREGTRTVHDIFEHPLGR